STSATGSTHTSYAIHPRTLLKASAKQLPLLWSYLQRRISEGKTTREAIRCIKRAVAREIYRVMTRPPNQESIPATNLAAPPNSRGLTLTHVAQALGTWPARISDIEKGKRPLPDLTERYKNWLLAA